MSQENVELVRGWFDRWNRGERSFSEVDSHPDVQIISRFRPDPYRGRDGFERWVQEIDEQFQDWQLVVEEWRDVGDAVVAFGHLHLHGQGSGIEFDQPMAWLIELDGNRLLRLSNFDKPDEALEAAGLGESAMSQENVELTRRAYEALERDDIEAFLSFLEPDVEWYSLILEIEGVFRGHDGVREWWRGIRTTFPDWRPSLVEVRAYGDRVVMHGRGSGSGAASGVDIDDDFWQVVEIRDGLVVWYRAVRTEKEAVEAAGLRE